MKIQFVKMQGLGNDFVVLDATKSPIHLTAQQAAWLADRHFGIGCDQILLVEPPPQEDVDFGYRIFNADGSEVNQCGNGARCFARFVANQGLLARCADPTAIRVQTRAGKMILRLQADGQVEVDMGIPNFTPENVPFVPKNWTEQADGCFEFSEENQKFAGMAVSLGNPHFVLKIEDVQTAPVLTLGAQLESDVVHFPERVNVGFAQKIDNHAIKLRVFERGSGETLACGSGACAAAVAGIRAGWLQSPVSVSLPGGDLQIAWAGMGHSVLMTGAATEVFSGVMDLSEV